MTFGKTTAPLTKITACVLFLIGLTASASAFDPYGKWMRPSAGAVVNFYNCGGKLCGKIVAVKAASTAKEVGTVIVSGAVKTGDNEWKGSLLDTDNGKTYTGVITLVGADGLNLKGCALGIICQGETWQRVK
jgi:uncharacterized protein (DUF2147 family)